MGLQQRLLDVTDQRGGVGVGHGDQELHVLFFVSSAPSSLSGLGPAAPARLQLAKRAMIGPGLVLLARTAPGQVPRQAVQVLGQTVQGGGGWRLGLCTVAMTFRVWVGGCHGDWARRGRRLSGSVAAPLAARCRRHGGRGCRHRDHSLHSGGGGGLLGERGDGPAHSTHALLPTPLALRVRVVRVRGQQIRAGAPGAPGAGAVLQVGRDQSQRPRPP